MLHRHPPAEPVRFSVLDLRTPTAFADENGTTRQGIESAGPVMVRCASLALLLFPTDAEAGPWPVEADEGWARVPERLYFDPRAEDPRSSGLERVVRADAPEPWGPLSHSAPSHSASITLVPTLPGPVFPSRDLAGSDSPRGELVVRSPAGRISLRVGGGAARQGVLLGRYERCDTTGVPVLSNPSLSRVNLLVIEMDGALYAVDTASSNGSWLGATRLRCARLLPDQRAAAYEATVEWRAFLASTAGPARPGRFGPPGLPAVIDEVGAPCTIRTCDLQIRGSRRGGGRPPPRRPKHKKGRGIRRRKRRGVAPWSC